MLTRRQAETLQKLLKLYGDSPAGVHYTVLAKDLGVGKWSAYEMLRGLEERGLTERRYDSASKSTHGGRPRVLFAPTPYGTTALAELLDGRGEEVEWSAVSASLLREIGDMTPDEVQKRLSDLHDPSALNRCAHLVTSLIVVARDVLRDSITWENLDRIVRSPVPFVTKLAAFAGALGSSHLAVADRASSDMEKLQDLLRALEFQVPRLRASERAALLEFVGKALRNARGTEGHEPAS
jgi:DNA-binding MarR family transcriptional regulator